MAEKKKILNTLMILSGLCLVAAIGYFIFLQMQFTTYKDGAYQFKIKYPSSWEVRRSPDPGVAVVFISPANTVMDLFRENVNVSVQDVPLGMATLKSFSSKITQQMTVVFKQNIKIIEDKDITVDDRSAHMMVFEAAKPDAMKSKIVWTIRNGKAFIITYMGRMSEYDSLQPALDTMIGSFDLP